MLRTVMIFDVNDLQLDWSSRSVEAQLYGNPKHNRLQQDHLPKQNSLLHTKLEEYANSYEW